MTASLGIAFWNTRLAPTPARRPPGTLMAKAASLITGVTATGLGFLGLCEIDTPTILDLKSRVPAFSNWKLEVFDRKDKSWNMGFLYDPGILTLLHQEQIEAQMGKRTARAGLRIELRVEAAAQTLTVFLSHWPSRGLGDGDDSNRMRTLCGEALWVKISALLRDDPNAWIILGGDFNDDPFAPSICHSIHSTRDPVFSIQRTILFNPTWSLLSGSLIDHGGAYGTACYNGLDTRWRTFDQILISPGLLDHDRYLSLMSVHRFDEAFFHNNDQGKRKFDHIPVAVRFATRSSS